MADDANDKSNSGNGQLDDKNAATKQADGTLLDKGQSSQTLDDKGQSQSDKVDWEAKAKAEEQARLKAENDFKEYQRGLTPKLEKLAAIEKEEATKIQQQPNEIQKIDEQIGKIDKNIVYYKSQNWDTTEIEATRLNLEFNRQNVIEKQGKQKSDKAFQDFAEAHKDFTDYTGLGVIIGEAFQDDGVVIGFNTAYKRWQDRQEIKSLKKSSEITAENKQLGDKALGADGKPAPKTPELNVGEKVRKDLWGV